MTSVRRSSARGRRGNSGPSVPPVLVTAYTPVSTTGFYRTAVASVIAGTPTAVGIMCRINSGAPSTSFLAHNGDTTGSLTGMFVRTSGATIFASAIDGAVAVRSSPSWTISGVGLVHFLVGVVDTAASRVRFYVDGVEQGTGGVCTGYTVPTAADRIGLGCSSAGGVVANQFDFLGFTFASGGIPTAGDITTWIAACKAANSCVSFPSSTTNRWQAEDNLAMGANWTDDIGALVAARSGAPVATTFTPAYA